MTNKKTCAIFYFQANADIRALLLDRLVETHLNGIKTHGSASTSHFELGDADWSVFRWALDQIHAGCWRKPEMVAYKYGGIGPTFAWRNEYSVLKEHISNLHEIIAGTI